jgi:hypothetical protein
MKKYPCKYFRLISFRLDWLLLSIILYFISFNLCSQTLDEKYITASKYVSDSINLCQEFEIDKSKKMNMELKKHFAGFKVSNEINFLNITSNMYKNVQIKNNIKLDSLFINDTIFHKNCYFNTFQNEQLSNLTTNPESVFILYFSKPIGNMLMVEILFCQSLWLSKLHKDKHYKGRKSYLNYIRVNENYEQNHMFGDALRMLFIFDEDKLVQSLKFPIHRR